MSEPVRLISREAVWQQDVQSDVVTTLEEMLERAKSGEFDGVALAATGRDGSSHTSFSKRNNAGLMLAAVTRLQFALLSTDREE